MLIFTLTTLAPFILATNAILSEPSLVKRHVSIRRELTARQSTATNWVKLGCYVDTLNPRSMLGIQITSNTMTNAFCQECCEAHGFDFAGTESGSECYCAASIDQQLLTADGDCDTTCNGAPEACGGNARLTVWQNQGAVVNPVTSTFDTSTTVASMISDTSTSISGITTAPSIITSDTSTTTISSTPTTTSAAPLYTSFRIRVQLTSHIFGYISRAAIAPSKLPAYTNDTSSAATYSIETPTGSTTCINLFEINASYPNYPYFGFTYVGPPFNAVDHVAQTPPGSKPQALGSSIGVRKQVESCVWTIDSTSNELYGRWIKSDDSVIPVYLFKDTHWFYAVTNFAAFTASSCPSCLQVRFFLEGIT